MKPPPKVWLPAPLPLTGDPKPPAGLLALPVPPPGPMPVLLPKPLAGLATVCSAAAAGPATGLRSGGSAAVTGPMERKAVAAVKS